MQALEKQYPPYRGNDPYLFLCFSQKSGKKARTLLERLFLRGVRVYYCTEENATRAEREESDRRMLSAALTVLLLDEALRSDPSAKGRLLACQSAGQRIVCLNTDGGDSGLSIGLHASAEEIRFSRGASAEDLERELVRADGFSRELIGEPAKVKRSGFRTAAVVMLVLAALLLAAGLLRYFTRPKPSEILPGSDSSPAILPGEEITPEPADTVEFSSEKVREAVRSALGGGILTQERLTEVITIRLESDTLPETLSDLELLPALRTIQLTQSAAKDVPEHEELFRYTIELIGGTMP